MDGQLAQVALRVPAGQGGLQLIAHRQQLPGTICSLPPPALASPHVATAAIRCMVHHIWCIPWQSAACPHLCRQVCTSQQQLRCLTQDHKTLPTCTVHSTASSKVPKKRVCCEVVVAMTWNMFAGAHAGTSAVSRTAQQQHRGTALEEFTATESLTAGVLPKQSMTCWNMCSKL